jgi:hypothetical protein
MVNIYIATIVAFGFGILTYWWGKRSAVEPVADHILNVLEEQGYIKTKTDANGDKELIKIK